jgi:hypothetical protein
MSFLDFRTACSIAIPLLLLIAGCAPPPEITAYTVQKDVSDRMLGGILIHDEDGWFFKLTGPSAELDRKKGEFEAFLKSVTISGGRPTWDLPEGWELDDKPLPPEMRRMRFATILVPLKGKKAELTVTTLPFQSDEGEFLAKNINRWRGQMSQGRLTRNSLKSLTQVETKSGPAYFVNIIGKLKAGPAMTPPFAGGGSM